MKGVVLDELLILVGNVLILNEFLGLPVLFHCQSQSHSFQATDMPLDVFWSGNLLSSSHLNSQITGIFSTI